MSCLFLGVDGGQSSTTALIGDESGRVLGLGTAGPCNHVRIGDGRDKFVRALTECVAAACRKARLDPQNVQFTSACLGFSGGPDDKRALVEEIIRTGQLVVTTDAWIALSGATGGEPGVITMAGTGSIAFGRNAAGQTARAGGWGYIFGDEGGAFDVVRQALRAMLRYEEGWGPPTSLTRKLLNATGAADANDLLHQFYTTDYPRDRIASMATLVDEAVLEGDAVAAQLVRTSAQHLASIGSAVREQLFRAGERVLVSFSGGAFHNALLLDHFKALIEKDVDCICRPPLYRPSMGALIDAWKVAGVSPAAQQ